MTVHIYWRPVDSPGEPFTHIGECEGVAFEHGEFKAPGGLLMVTPRPHDGWCGRGLSMLPGPNDGLRIDLSKMPPGQANRRLLPRKQTRTVVLSGSTDALGTHGSTGGEHWAVGRFCP